MDETFEIIETDLRRCLRAEFGDQQSAEYWILVRGGVSVSDWDFAISKWHSARTDYGRPWAYIRSVALGHAAIIDIGCNERSDTVGRQRSEPSRLRDVLADVYT